MTRAPNVRLALTNLPENVSLVRELLNGLAGVVPLGDGLLDDVKTVVSEACNNVVIHAYDGEPGPLDVEVSIADDQLEITVRDSGGGIRPRLEPYGELQGIGIPVIHALSDRVEFSGGIGEGTQVRMHFDVPGARDLGPLEDEEPAAPPADEPAAAPADEPRPPPSGGLEGRCDDEPRTLRDQQPAAPRGVDETVERTARAQQATLDDGATASLEVAPASLARSVLGRPLAALAARARFSIDRLSDLQLVTDAITAHAGRALRGSRLRVDVAVATRDVELRFGPLRPGSARQRVLDSAFAGLAPLIETLADEVRIDRLDGSEVLMLRLLDSR